MFGLPKIAWQAISTVVFLALGFGVIRCYGGDRYERGRREAEVAHTDSVRIVLTKALDSANAVMVPVLEQYVRQNDSLRAVSAALRESARSAAVRARRAEAALVSLPDSVRLVTPPEVVALIDSLVLSSVALRGELDKLTVSNAALSAQNDSVTATARDWQRQYGAARAALDTAAKEIRQLQKLKKPPRCGFKCGAVTATLTIGAIVASIFVVGR